MAKKAPGSLDLQAALSELRKEGMEVGVFSDFAEMTPVGLSTGNITLDTLTGIGGFPTGRITELVGPPSSGKTTAALQECAHVQQAGGIVVYLDYERSLDPVYCAALGLDVHSETFIYAKPEHFEAGANAFRKLTRTGEIRLGVHDSIAAMVTQHELEADTGKVMVGDRAKMMHQYCRQLNPLLSRTGTGAVFINHQMEAIDTSPMGQRMAAQGIKKKVSPGGNAVPYYASLRVEFKQIGNLKTDEMDNLTNEVVSRVSQTKTQATVIKNKVGEAFRTAELRVRFGKGFSQEYSVLSILLAHKLIKKSGAWIKFGDFAISNEYPQVQGEDAALNLMEDNPEWFATLEAKAREIIAEAGVEAFDTIDSSSLDENGFTPEQAAKAEADANESGVPVDAAADLTAGSAESLEDL